MNSDNIYKLSTKELVSEATDIKAYYALKTLYSKAYSADTAEEDIENYAFVQSYIHHLYFDLTSHMEELEAIKNRSFLEKLKDLFSK